jgi:hypothetical protein
VRTPRELSGDSGPTLGIVQMAGSSLQVLYA